jgi:hypothetical protein
MESMDPRHARIVSQEVLGGRQAIDEGQRYSKLTINALRYIYRHLSGGTPLALPFSVAAVYLKDPDVVAIHDCEECGYRVPVCCPEPLATPPKPVRVYFDRCHNRLMEWMDPSHACIVRQEVLGGRQAPDGEPRYSKLTINALRYIYRHLSDGTPLALPFSVAAVYLEDPNVMAYHDCEECGYRVPVGCPEPLAIRPKPVRLYFERCPLCGGRIGYAAFRRRNASAIAGERVNSDAAREAVIRRGIQNEDWDQVAEAVERS